MTEVVKKPAIIRGRIALAIVFLVRFVEPAEAGTKALAEKYGTTVGKIDDIRKNRNFAYVTEDVKFTEDQVKEAVTYISAHEDADHAVVVTDMLNELPIATAEEAEAFAGVKRKAGGQPRTDAEGNVIQSGGGNRQKSGKKKAEPEQDPAEVAEIDTDEPAADEPAADDLLDI
jgi:hypothetical protein